MVKHIYKQSSIGGTFITNEIITPQTTAKYSRAKIYIQTNERPLNFQKGQSNYLGWFYSLEDLTGYFEKTSKVYKLVKALTTQNDKIGAEFNILTNKNFAFMVVYREITDATNSYLITKGIEDRVINFSLNGESRKVFYLTVNCNGTTEIKKAVIYNDIIKQLKPLTPLIEIDTEHDTEEQIAEKEAQNAIIEAENAITTQENNNITKENVNRICDFLNTEFGFNCLFEVVDVVVDNADPQNPITDKEIKINSLLIGTNGQISLSATNIPASETDAVDLYNDLYLKGSDITSYQGEDNVFNDLDDTYFKNSLQYLSEQGYNFGTITSCIMYNTSKLIEAVNELNTLQNSLNFEKTIGFVYGYGSKEYIKKVNADLNNDTLLICAGSALTTEGVIATIGAILSGYCKKEFNIDGNFRNDIEWGTIVYDNDIINKQRLFDNQEINDITNNTRFQAISYNGEGLGIVVHGSVNGWSIIEKAGLVDCINYSQTTIVNTMRSVVDKTKSGDGKMSVLVSLNNLYNTFLNNGLLSTEPKANDIIFSSLTNEQKNQIRRKGFIIEIPELSTIEGGDIPVNYIICFRGIMTKFTNKMQILSNN